MIKLEPIHVTVAVVDGTYRTVALTPVMLTPRFITVETPAQRATRLKDPQ